MHMPRGSECRMSTAAVHEPRQLKTCGIAYHKKQNFSNKKRSRNFAATSLTILFYQKSQFVSTFLAGDSSNSVFPRHVGFPRKLTLAINDTTFFDKCQTFFEKSVDWVEQARVSFKTAYDYPTKS